MRTKEQKERHKLYCREWKKKNLERVREINERYYQKHKKKVLEYICKWHKENPEKVKEIRKEGYKKNRKKCLEYQQKYRKTNRECILKRSKEWRKNNLEHRSRYSKMWRQHNLERCKEIVRQSGIKWRKFHPEYLLQNKKWRKDNPEHATYLSKCRRVRKVNAEGFHTLKEWLGLKEQYNYTCPACGKKEPEISLTEDHIVPLSRKGTDNLLNLQPLCGSCNSRKATKVIKYEQQNHRSIL